MEPQNLQSKKDNTKKILIAIIIALVLAIATMAYLWNSQTQDLQFQNDKTEQRIKELEDKLLRGLQADETSENNQIERGYLNIEQWGVKLKQPDPAISYQIKDGLLYLTDANGKKLTDLENCEDIISQSGGYYPVYIERSKTKFDESTPRHYAAIFNKKIGDYYYYAYSQYYERGACSPETQTEEFAVVDNIKQSLSTLESL
jgi:hypothetical protein